MVKGNPKSSATSATRKKHLKKHAPADELPKEKKVKGKAKKNEPRVKMYIPPVKPAPVQPDPLDTTGLAHTLHPDLLVVLRNISKKAQITKTRALEELQSAWVNQCLKEGRDSTITDTLVEMLPVWLHHVSALFVNSSRRVRLLTASLHATLLQIPPVRDQILFLLRESLPESQLETVLGTWCLSAHDVDRQVSGVSQKAWKDVVSSEDSPATFVLTKDNRLLVSAFIERAALDPTGVYDYLNPSPPPPPVNPTSNKRELNKSHGGKAAAVTTPHRDDGDATPRSKVDEQEESDLDRRARLRISALGAARWIAESGTSLTEELVTFYSNPALWTVLYSGESPPWIEGESFGWAQPNVRKAGWSLIHTLITLYQTQLEPAVPTVGWAILRSAWIETDTLVQGTMWEPLLKFLKQFPQCWTVNVNKAQEDQGESDSEGDNAEEDHAPQPSQEVSQAYNEFLAFLQSGCSGSPIQGYPAVVIIVSTIPSLALFSSVSHPPVSTFFNAFWEAVNSRALSALHRVTASAAFLSSLLECSIFLIKRIRNDLARSRNSPAEAEEVSSVAARTAETSIIQAQFSRIWDELASSKLKVEERAAARLLAQTLENLNSIDPKLLEEAWNVISDSMKGSVARRENSSLVSAVLKVFYDRFRKEKGVLKKDAEVLMDEVLNLAIEQCYSSLNAVEGNDEKTGSALMLSIFDRFRDGLFYESSFSDRLDALVFDYAYRLLSISPSLLLAYLLHRKDEEKATRVWHTLLSAIRVNSQDGRGPDQTSFDVLLDAAQQRKLPDYLKPHAGVLDSFVGTMLEYALHDPEQTQKRTLVKRILGVADYFLSFPAQDMLWQMIAATFNANIDALICGEEVHHYTVDICVDLIGVVFTSAVAQIGKIEELLVNLFLYSFLVPIVNSPNEEEVDINHSQSFGRDLWQKWIQDSDQETRARVLSSIKDKLAGFIRDPNVQPLPEDILNLLTQSPPGFEHSALEDILPSATYLDEALDMLSPDAIDPSVAVLDALIPVNSTSSSRGQTPMSTDRRGFSAYARAAFCQLHALCEDRQLAKRNLWVLRHFFALSVYAQDVLDVPAAIGQSPVFNENVKPAALVNIVARTRQVSVYLLRTSAVQDDDTWRSDVLTRLNEDKPKEESQRLQTFLYEAIMHARRLDSLRDARVLKIVLDALLQDGLSVDEGELWVQYARKIEKTAPQTAMTIMAAVTRSGGEPTKLDRYRNELAANLTGIKVARANTEGLLSLRRLAATAPDPDGSVIFLQPPRAVNVIKGCQAWVLAEDDEGDELDEEVESAMLTIFMHLAPILQNVPGSHWPFIFDVLESVLERVSPPADEEQDAEDDTSAKSTSMVAFARSLRLLQVLEQLAKRNKSLMQEWKERRMVVLTLVRDSKILGNETSFITSAPHSTCRELLLSIIQHLPSSLIDETTLPKMCHLVNDSSVPVQKMAYQLLRVAAQKRTEHFVIEAGVDTEETVKAVLPAELVSIIQRDIHYNHIIEDEDEYNDQGQNVFGYLLGWMLVFDLFQDASFKVKTSYIEHLRNSNLILDHFIPSFLEILRLDQGNLFKVFKLDLWAVDKFYVDLYEPGSPHAIPVLTAHLYYRALLAIPSLFHSWVLDSKDRQLTSIVTSYTSTYFSPVLIRSELEHVRSHATTDGLVDDSMSVKVANAVNEVAAIYSVDEHQLEIKLRIPNDWPLHKIEIRDGKKFGVDENRWRAWVLGVQQTIWAHNGRIIDGLGLFKKNVTLHFEGQVECAICYSIISVMDGALPKRPCKTCKNRFHAGCLYKWFNTSHSSSCPLCRSDII